MVTVPSVEQDIYWQVMFAVPSLELDIRDVIQSSNIRRFKSRSEVRIQFLHLEVRIKYQKCSKMSYFI